MISFGKHSGKTFAEVEAEDCSYCNWALGVPDPSPTLKDFVEYLRAKYGGVMKIGVHKGVRYSDIARDVPTYCEWAIALPDPSGPMTDFVEWLKAQGFQSGKKRASSDKAGSPKRTKGCAESSPRKVVESESSDDSEDEKSSKKKPAPKNAKGKNLKEKVTKARESSKASSSKDVKKDSKKVKSTKESKRGSSGNDDCKICLVAAVETVFVPCGHMATCIECGERMVKRPCPICRQKVKKVVKTYKT